MAAKGSRWPLRLLVALFFLLSTTAAVGPVTEADALLMFKHSIVDSRGVLSTWTSDTQPCVGRHSNWTGVFCDTGGNVIKLVLENLNLSGTLNTDPLVTLRGLRSLSFMNNDFEGPMPNVGSFVWLRTLYLSGNRLSGRIPDDEFSRMVALNRVYLARNGFWGPIPASLAKVVRLAEMKVEGNKFDGSIPEFRQPGLKANLSYNSLEGPIPAGLGKLDPSAFIGNKGLCGPPLGSPCSPNQSPLTPPSTADTPSTPTTFPTPSTPPLAQPASPNPSISTKNSIPRVAAVFLSILAFLALLALFFAILRRRGEQEEQLGRPPSSSRVVSVEAERPSPAHSGSSGKKAAKDSEHGRLVFVREGRERFELQDLLRAAAEVLGSGSFGSSYKAVLLSGAAVVVKRFKEMNAVGREDFSEHMRRLGRLSHPNLLPLVAYYYRREEKLLMFDYIPNRSLAHILHGNNGPEDPKLDWPSRLSIVKGVAKGLAYLHNELPVLNLPHGHLKSSNVLLDDNLEALLTDYALTPVMNGAHAAQVMVAYKAPESVQYGRTTTKADVWSLGILILEILTGKFPASYLLQGNEGVDMASWVKSVVGEEPEKGKVVFDKNMGESGGRHEEVEMMKKLLQIGLGCCEADPGKRWDLTEAMEKIEELKESDHEEFSSCSSD